VRSTAGTVRLLDGDPWADATDLHRRLAYVPGEVNLWPQLTGGEVIDLLGRLRGGVDRVRRDEMLQRFELDPTKKGTHSSNGRSASWPRFANAELYILDGRPRPIR
jgi:ABC-2 type transport system ATP-binding protein